MNQSTNICDRPCAVAGLISYRYHERYTWIMIGARDHADAMNEAARSTDHVTPDRLQVWDSTSYVQAYP